MDGQLLHHLTSAMTNPSCLCQPPRLKRPLVLKFMTRCSPNLDDIGGVIIFINLFWSFCCCFPHLLLLFCLLCPPCLLRSPGRGPLLTLLSWGGNFTVTHRVALALYCTSWLSWPFQQYGSMPGLFPEASFGTCWPEHYSPLRLQRYS